LAHGEKIEEGRRHHRHAHHGQQPKPPKCIHSPNTEATARQSESKPASPMVPPSSMKPSQRFTPSGRFGDWGAGRGALRLSLTRPYIAFAERLIKSNFVKDFVHGTNRHHRNRADWPRLGHGFRPRRP
jgi:hypothetical protein